MCGCAGVRVCGCACFSSGPLQIPMCAPICACLCGGVRVWSRAALLSVLVVVGRILVLVQAGPNTRRHTRFDTPLHTTDMHASRAAGALLRGLGAARGAATEAHSTAVAPAAGEVARAAAIAEAVFTEEEMVDLTRAGSMSMEECRALGIQIFPRAITTSEEEALLREVERSLRRDKYEDGHWDSAIKGFREVLKSQWRLPDAKAVIDRVRTHPALAPFKLAPAAHVLDLAPHGEVLPHIDSVKFVSVRV